MKKSLYSIGFIALILGLIITSVEVLSFNKGYYEKQYHKLEIAKTIGISEVDLMRTTDDLLDYIKGHREDLDIVVVIDGVEVQMFNQREIDHMVDVQVLMLNVLFLRNVLILTALLIFLYALISKDIFDLVLMFQALIQGGGIMILVLGFIGVYAVVDFDSFWIQFHELLFTNDLWLLDPNTDRLIMMVPQAFFSGLVYRILIAVTCIVLGFIGLAFGLQRRIKYVAHRSL